MNHDENFSFYGSYPVDNIKNILQNGLLDWTKYNIRQRACSDMRHTQTIPIVYDRDFFSTNYKPVYDDNYKLFENELNKISEIITKKTEGNGYLLRAILVKLLAGKSIPTHTDTANETFKVSRRIHLPIITNERCFFTVGNETINMKEGELWEMNNDKKEHSVHNDGNEDRIHLIIDWCEKNPHDL
jgi:hypothetical protein